MPLVLPKMHSSVGACTLLAAVVLAVAALGQPCEAAAGAETPQYERVDAGTIKTYTQDILADPRFSPRKTFRQWLREKLRSWGGPRLGLPHGVSGFLLWAVVSWCLLALLAVLIHLGWTIWMAVRRPRSPGTPGPRDGPALYEQLSFEQLWQKSRELAQQGAFRDAVGVLLVALLRRLETFDVLRFHTSKTNGEYLREYPGRLAGRPQFVQFVAMFERTIYGGLEVPRQAYETMDNLAQQIVGDVAQKPQV